MNRYASLNRKMLLLFAVALVAPLSLIANAQDTREEADAGYAPTLTFDVASITENKADTSHGFMMGGPNPPHSSKLSVTNLTASDLISWAYGVDKSRISGLPEWATSIRFNVQAKSDSTVDDVLAKLNDSRAKLEKQHMFQTMLADRFQLKVHPDSREATIYELTIARGGPKLQEEKPASPDGAKDSVDANRPTYRQSCNQSGCEMTAQRYSMKSLSGVLSSMFATTVVDKTGLTGSYDFTLQYSGTGVDPSEDETKKPSMLTAVQEQIGLKLKPLKGMVPGLVIDHIEKPSEN
jgi:uncharacterized protein (TIGR03435 family)